MNQFNRRAALPAKHAQQVLIHSPIASFMASFVFDLLELWKTRPNPATAANYDLITAAVGDLARNCRLTLAWQWYTAAKGSRANRART